MNAFSFRIPMLNQRVHIHKLENNRQFIVMKLHDFFRIAHVYDNVGISAT